jgi:exodeoxyribonuclease VII small subunit
MNATPAPSAASPVPADIAKMSFEDALKELEDIVRALEQGKGKLDESVAAYERGATLKRHCEAKLAEAGARIERIQISAGRPVAAPFDAGS